ncbi:MAG: hypothetical protein ACRCYU_18475, partial [Nocardioides sp.]
YAIVFGLLLFGLVNWVNPLGPLLLSIVIYFALLCLAGWGCLAFWADYSNIRSVTLEKSGGRVEPKGLFSDESG